MSDLHNAIMNIPCVVPEGANINQAISYKVGHKDARHAAAELAATHAGAAAEPVPVAGFSDESFWEMWRATNKDVNTGDILKNDIVFFGRVVARAALTSAPAEPDAYNRRLRAQLEQEWADLQRLKNAYTPAETPPAAGAIDARGQEQISALIVRALRAADMQLSAWENGYAFDSHGPSREAQRLVTEALAALSASFGEKQS